MFLRYIVNKINYISLIKGNYTYYELTGGSHIKYTQNEIDYINNNVKYLIHWTTIDKFKKIMKCMEIQSNSVNKDLKDENFQYNYVVFAGNAWLSLRNPQQIVGVVAPGAISSVSSTNWARPRVSVGRRAAGCRLLWRR